MDLVYCKWLHYEENVFLPLTQQTALKLIWFDLKKNKKKGVYKLIRFKKKNSYADVVFCFCMLAQAALWPLR
jgi:hypothetical protein